MRWDEEDKDETRRGGRREKERMDGGKKEGKVERFALCSGWMCVWGRCFCLRGLRGGGTGMVERLAIHRPKERQRMKAMKGEKKKNKMGVRLFPLSRFIL